MLTTLLIQLPSGSDISEIAKGQDFTAAGILLLVCIWMAYSKWSSDKAHREEIKAKDEKIMKVVDDHKSDLKENNKDYQQLVDKYHQFTEQIRAIANVSR